jgi:hypothetical protein
MPRREKSKVKPNIHASIGRALRNGIKHSNQLEWAFADDERLGAWLRQCLRLSRMDIHKIPMPRGLRLQ